MNILILLAHPDPNSFNHAIADAAIHALEEGSHKVIFHDLYREGFGPLLPSDEIPEGSVIPDIIAMHCRELANADGIIVIHPNWWGQPPAILTGYIDRVFRPGIAYKFSEGDSGEGVPAGLLKAQVALVFNTSNTRPDRETESFGDPLQSLWKRCVFDLCGVTTFDRRTFSVVVTSTMSQRQAWLNEAMQLVRSYFPAATSRVQFV